MNEEGNDYGGGGRREAWNVAFLGRDYPKVLTDRPCHPIVLAHAVRVRSAYLTICGRAATRERNVYEVVQVVTLVRAK
jgi:hypothetical protein